MGAKAPQYPPSVETLPDGTANPLYDPAKEKPAPPPPPPPRLILQAELPLTPRSIRRILRLELYRLIRG